MKSWGGALLLACVAGCATVHKMDRQMLTQFQMVEPGQWTMSAGTAANYPVDSEKAESIRLGWIDQYIRANGCTTFKVESRGWTKTPTDNFMVTGASDNVGRLYYKGTCQ